MMVAKKVVFNERDNKVHYIVAWSYAYNSARKKYWEYFVIDRIHFRRRVENMSFIISPILENKHRAEVYNNRFINVIAVTL